MNPLNINSFSQFVNDFWKWKLVFQLTWGTECYLSPDIMEPYVLAELPTITSCHQLEQKDSQPGFGQALSGSCSDSLLKGG